jgi:D-xylose transport system substrate-binding protein
MIFPYPLTFGKSLSTLPIRREGSGSDRQGDFMHRSTNYRTLTALTISALAVTLAACSSSTKSTATPGTTTAAAAAATTATKSAGGGAKIALLLPESKTTRYEALDRPLFTKKVAELCKDCEIVYNNADQDAAKQQSQAEAALAQGVKVLVLDAVDVAAAVTIVKKAEAKGVPVVAYDRLISDAPIAFYVSFDNLKIGEQQGSALLEAISAGGDPKRGKIVMIHGSPTDPSAGDYKKGAHNSLDGKADVGREFDTPDWSPDKAQQEMEQAITALGKDKIIGVYAANDGTAGGAIAAMKRAGLNPIPPITGQDAELAAVQRIITGDQYQTTYLRIKDEADAAAIAAVDIATGKKPAGGTTTKNGAGDIPTVLVQAVSVTQKNLASTIIADGFYKPAELCIDDVAAACKKLSIG